MNRGGIESDVTVTQIDANTFRMISGTALHSHDMAWLTDHLPADGSVILEGYNGIANLFWHLGTIGTRISWHTNQRRPLHESNAISEHAEAQIGEIPVQWCGSHLLENLVMKLYAPVGKWIWPYGKCYGRRASHSVWLPAVIKPSIHLRAEKGYLYWGADITPDETPHEAGLSFAVCKRKRVSRKESAVESHAEEKTGNDHLG